MKIFWLNGGLRLEPEGRAEWDAIGLLFDSARRTSLDEETKLAREQWTAKEAASAPVCHNAAHGGVGNPQVLVVDAGPREFVDQKSIIGAHQSGDPVE